MLFGGNKIVRGDHEEVNLRCTRSGSTPSFKLQDGQPDPASPLPRVRLSPLKTTERSRKVHPVAKQYKEESLGMQLDTRNINILFTCKRQCPINGSLMEKAESITKIYHDKKAIAREGHFAACMKKCHVERRSTSCDEREDAPSLNVSIVIASWATSLHETKVTFEDKLECLASPLEIISKSRIVGAGYQTRSEIVLRGIWTSDQQRVSSIDITGEPSSVNNMQSTAVLIEQQPTLFSSFERWPSLARRPPGDRMDIEGQTAHI
ncbi:uncharacterized protein EDB91DRAFT_1086337 [Suillus paluster]|uniref:uncharacterized protein n=1 Tax=Suillus paluster TaxID=48578 RepID=UPI001B85D324|nr:uncharacterized protein EDB91DRAFT_1086337 [Suillus paluster]KAG1727671.1 hypothetical protein EDB91DRAFT_1086337 [Suillus paluster]